MGELSVAEAGKNYFFNCQIVTLPDGTMCMIAPEQCRQGNAQGLIDRILAANNPISEVRYVNLNQSMRNGGGPACLRLRIAMNKEEAAQIQPGYLLDDEGLRLLELWISKHYREGLKVDDLGDYHLLEESRHALDELTRIMNLGRIYAFQKN